MMVYFLFSFLVKSGGVYKLSSGATKAKKMEIV